MLIVTTGGTDICSIVTTGGTDICSVVTTDGRTDPCLVLTVLIERSAFPLIFVSGEVEEMWKCSRYTKLRFCAAALGTSD